MWRKREMCPIERKPLGLVNPLCVLHPLRLDVEKRKNPVCGFVTPLEGSEADSHGKPEASKTRSIKKIPN